MMDAKQYWNDRYKNGNSSGYGSYGEQLKKKLGWLSGLDVTSISEIGCGDLNFATHLLHLYRFAKPTYTGQDISDLIINKHKIDYPLLNFVNNIDDLPQSDLLLCVDVLFHVLDDNEVEPLLQKIESKWTKYLAITAYERDEEMNGHVRIRKFDPSRFGVPIIREIVEEDGSLYFYLFKKEDGSNGQLGDQEEKLGVDLSQVSCCLVTKEHDYPIEILEKLSHFNFGEVLIVRDSNSPYRKYEAIKRAKFDLIYYQDDDAICPIEELAQWSNPSMINVVMKQEHFDAYKDKRMTMGLGWGSIFPKAMLESLKKYTNVYGEDEIYKRETERILTYLNFPQNRLVFPVQDLPSAWAQDRLWREPRHYDNIKIVEERCQGLVV